MSQSKYTTSSMPLTNSHCGPQPKRPEERHPPQVAQEQRRIADRQQAAAAVAHNKDEEHHRVRHVLPLAVGPQQRPDQQHRRAGGADEAGQQSPHRHERGRVRHRVARQVAPRCGFRR